MNERTEELGLAARLPVWVGGQLFELRTLNLDESEEWQAKLAGALAQAPSAIAAIDKPTSVDLAAAIAKQPTAVMLELLEAYDLDGRLPKNLRQRMTQVELYDAVKSAARAEAPFLEDARSVAVAFGPQIRALLTSVAWEAIQSQQARSTNGHAPSGTSTQPSSDDDSPRNGSSSSGNTPSAELAARPTRNRSARRSQ